MGHSEFISSVSKELANVLSFIGSLHWACVGLAFVAYAINQVDKKNKNHQQCCDLLLKLLQFWEIAIRPLLNHEEELIQKYIGKGIEVIAESVLFCGQFLHTGTLSRFIFTDSHKNTLDELKVKVKDARDEIKDVLFFDLYAKVTSNSKSPVEHQQPPQRRKSSIFTVALTQRTEEVLSLLKLEERDTIGAVVLHGMGGVGKSTLADSVYDNKIRWMGDIACSCIRLKKGFSVTELQKQMMKDLNIGGCSSIKEELWQVLSSLDRPVFIYIDNILEMRDLEDFLPTFLEEIELPKGSRLMLTTRDLNVCTKVLGRNKSIVIRKYPVKCLNLREGKELLKACAFGIPSQDREGDNEKEISEELIEKIVETCGGLPLAITVLGKQLYGADDIEWERALEKLNRTTRPTIVEDQVLKVLQYSYDALDVDCRKAFVFVSTFWDAVGDDLKLQWSQINSIVESLCSGISLETLVNYALVEPSQHYLESTGGYRLTIKMHDLLLSLGHQIAKRENIRIKRVEDESSFQEMDTVEWCDIQWLIVDDIEGGFPAHHLDKCERLEMLILLGTLGGRPEKVPTKLKVLILTSTEEDDIPWNLESLENLVYFATDLGCSTFPVSSKQIRIFRGFHNERFPDELVACHRLRKLECKRIPQFPTNFFQRMTGLRSLRLAGNGELPQDLGGLRNLHRLQISSGKVRVLPQSLVELRRLRVLLLYCSELEQLPEGFGSGLKALCYLIIRSEQMTTLPEDMGNLKELQSLQLVLPMLETLPPTFSQLANLLSFHLDSACPLKSLAGLEGQLTSLESLTLSYYTSSSRYYTSSSPDPTPIPATLLPSLQNFNLLFFPMPELPPGIGKLVSLKTLKVSGARRLQTLPKVKAAPSLEVMVLQDCRSLTTLQEVLSEEAVDDNIGNNNISSLPSTSLIVADCPSLQLHSIPPDHIQIYDKKLPQSIANFLMNTFHHPHLDMLSHTLF